MRSIVLLIIQSFLYTKLIIQKAAIPRAITGSIDNICDAIFFRLFALEQDFMQTLNYNRVHE